MHWHVVDRELNRYIILYYVFQSLLAVFVLMAILYILDVTVHLTIVAAMGSTAFIIFAMPHSITARPRNVIGGHLMGVLAGVSCLLLLGLLSQLRALLGEVFYIALYSLSVGLSTLAMVVSDTEHPPAAGTALGIVVSPWSWRIVVFILASAVLLSLAKWILRSKLKDLV